MIETRLEPLWMPLTFSFAHNGVTFKVFPESDYEGGWDGWGVYTCPELKDDMKVRRLWGVLREAQKALGSPNVDDGDEVARELAARIAEFVESGGLDAPTPVVPESVLSEWSEKLRGVILNQHLTVKATRNDAKLVATYFPPSNNVGMLTCPGGWELEEVARKHNTTHHPLVAFCAAAQTLGFTGLTVWEDA